MGGCWITPRTQGSWENLPNKHLFTAIFSDGVAIFARGKMLIFLANIVRVPARPRVGSPSWRDTMNENTVNQPGCLHRYKQAHIG